MLGSIYDNFVIKVMQLYLGPEIQKIIIFIDVRFHTYSCYGKILNRSNHCQ